MDFDNICTGCGRPHFALPIERYNNLIEQIAEKHSCKDYEITVAQLKGDSREQALVYARHECYYVLHQIGLSSSQIGRIMKRDHTSILHGIKNHRYRVDRGDFLLQKMAGE